MSSYCLMRYCIDLIVVKEEEENGNSLMPSEPSATGSLSTLGEFWSCNARALGSWASRCFRAPESEWTCTGSVLSWSSLALDVMGSACRTWRMYPRPVESDPDVFQLSVTNVDATVMGKICMFSDCKKMRSEIMRTKILHVVNYSFQMFARQEPWSYSF